MCARVVVVEARVRGGVVCGGWVVVGRGGVGAVGVGGGGMGRVGGAGAGSARRGKGVGGVGGGGARRTLRREVAMCCGRGDVALTWGVVMIGMDRVAT